MGTGAEPIMGLIALLISAAGWNEPVADCRRRSTLKSSNAEASVSNALRSYVSDVIDVK